MKLSTFVRATLSFRTVLLAAAHSQSVHLDQQTCSKSDDSCNKPQLDNSNMSEESWKSAKSVYDFSARDIDGKEVSLDKYRGQILIIVNVACKCGFTNNHYKELVELHEKYREKGLSILGFPCNQFGGQEPAPEKEIKEFVQQFQVGFDMFSKVEVNGSSAHPLWKYLKDKQGGTLIDAVKWNFTKFIVDRQGQPVARYSPQTSPKELDEVLQKYL